MAPAVGPIPGSTISSPPAASLTVEAKTAEALALATGVADILTTPPGPTAFYECGVDLAIDPDDRLWFIEANPALRRTAPSTSARCL